MGHGVSSHLLKWKRVTAELHSEVQKCTITRVTGAVQWLRYTEYSMHGGTAAGGPPLQRWRHAVTWLLTNVT